MLATDLHQTPDTDAVERPTVLCVDDETSILASLKRALRKQPYDVVTANSGDEAIAFLESRKVDLIISDMRMPSMSGAELLTRVYQQWPDTIRILLTGYADMESTVAAINGGQIFRYLNKPWNNDELVVAIDNALDHKRLKDEHAALTALTTKQNEELKVFNTALESKVEARTQELASAHDKLNETYDALRDSYQSAIRVFAQLVELREGSSHHHSQNVADTSRQIGERLDLSAEDMTDLQNAAVLHDIGQLGFSDELVSTPVNTLSADQMKIYRTHPGIGQGALLSIPALEHTGNLIRAHHEQFDGKGFPDGLAGEDIPLGARIIAIAADFDDLQTGLLLGRPLSTAEALDHLQGKAGTHYDPQLVDIMKELVSEPAGDSSSALQEYSVHLSDLQPGMKTARNITAQNGMLLLGAGQVLTESLISRINRCLDDTGGSKLVAIVKQSNVSAL